MTARDYLAGAEAVFAPAEATVHDLALLAIAADVRRIADQLERPLEPVAAVPVETDPVPLVAKLRLIIAQQRRALGGVVPEPERDGAES